MQMMPATAKRFGLKDPFDATANVEAGTKYLKWLLKRFDGDVTLALAGYNAGEGSVAKYKGIPPYPETQNYVKKIVSNYGKVYHPILPPEEAKLAFNLTSATYDYRCGALSSLIPVAYARGSDRTKPQTHGLWLLLFDWSSSRALASTSVSLRTVQLIQTQQCPDAIANAAGDGSGDTAATLPENVNLQIAHRPIPRLKARQLRH